MLIRKFTERKKASRLVKQLRRQLADAKDAEEKDRLERELHVAEVDETYTQHHPHAEAYISLYGNIKKSAGKKAGGKEKDDEEATDDDAMDKDGNNTPDAPAAKKALLEKRPEMWYTVEKAMEGGGRALHRLRERRSQDGEGQAVVQAKSKKAPKNGPKESKQTEPPLQRQRQETAAKKEDAQFAGLNRRERRKLMKKSNPSFTSGGLKSGAGADEEDDGEGFFEEV